MEAGSSFRHYVGLSLKPQYLITNNFEVFGDSEESVRRAFEGNKGGSLLGGIVLGGKFGIATSASVDIGLSLYGDILQFGYDGDSALKTNNLAAIHIGLNLF